MFCFQWRLKNGNSTYNGMLQPTSSGTIYILQASQETDSTASKLANNISKFRRVSFKKNRSHNGRGRASLAPSSIMNFELGTKEIDKLVHLKIKNNTSKTLVSIFIHNYWDQRINGE